MERLSYTYIVASRTRVLYTGITDDLRRRMMEHRLGEGGGFTAKYCCHRLVWFEIHADKARAVAREKELKGWTRAKKTELIEAGNRTWSDLSLELFDWETRAKAGPSSLRSSG